MNLKKTQRSPERIIKLYNWLWDRAVKSKHPSFYQLQADTLTGRCIALLIPQRLRIKEAMKSPAYRKAVAKIIHSN